MSERNITIIHSEYSFLDSSVDSGVRNICYIYNFCVMTGGVSQP